MTILGENWWVTTKKYKWLWIWVDNIVSNINVRYRNGQWCFRFIFFQLLHIGEAGLLISKVNAKNPFFGYAGSKRHTEKKLLCEVFKKGDLYFNTGDLMVQDHDNFLYFWDRIGDTFRYNYCFFSHFFIKDIQNRIMWLYLFSTGTVQFIGIVM